MPIGPFFRRLSLFLPFHLLFSAALFAQWQPLNPVRGVEHRPDGADLVLEKGFLRFQVCTDSIVRVVYTLNRNSQEHPDFLVIAKSWPKANFTLRDDDPKNFTLSTSQLKIVVSRSDSSVVFLDSAGNKLTQENARSLTPVEVNGEKTFHSERFTNMWTGATPSRGSQLPRRVGGYFTGQHQHFRAPFAVEQRLRDFLEQRLAHALQQSLSACALHQFRSFRFH